MVKISFFSKFPQVRFYQKLPKSSNIWQSYHKHKKHAIFFLKPRVDSTIYIANTNRYYVTKTTQ